MTVTDVTDEGKLTEPVAAPLAVIFIALPPEAAESLTTLAPAGKFICSASRVVTNGDAAKVL